MKRATIKVHHPDDPGRYMLVAEHRYDPERHRKWADNGGGREPTPQLRVVQTSESPEWWKVVDQDGNPQGPAKRTREEAEALREELAGG